MGTPVRVFLDSNVLWKQFGLNDTFRTLFITTQTQAEDMSKMVLTKITRGASASQFKTISDHCEVLFFLSFFLLLNRFLMYFLFTELSVVY